MNKYWETICKEMKKVGISSWYQLSKKTNIHENTLNSSRMRNGYLTFENTCKIANVLNISLDKLNEWK